MSSIFISHASKDKFIVDAFVDELLVGALSIKISEIFCTTVDGTKIISGLDWREAIKEHLMEAKITFLIISPNYKESEMCLNEMGAAWVLTGAVIPLTVEPINYKSVGILQEVNQIENLQDEQSLDKIRDVVQEKLSIPAKEIKSDRWTKKKKGFLRKAKKYIKSNPFQSPIIRDVYEVLSQENIVLREEHERQDNLVLELNARIEEIKNAKRTPMTDDVYKALAGENEVLRQEHEMLGNLLLEINAMIEQIKNGKRTVSDEIKRRTAKTKKA